MLISIGIVLIVGFFGSFLFDKLHLPGLVGMILAGICIGISGFDLLSQDLMDIAGEIRQVALIIILTRAGLSLDLYDFKKMGITAIFMSCVPALFEIGACIILAPNLLGISVLEAALLGCVLAAVSPAVIVPRMLRLIKNKFGYEKKIPQLILTGASLDDIVVISIFSVILSFLTTGVTDLSRIFDVPNSIVSGIIAGILCGYVLQLCFKKIGSTHWVETLCTLALSFLIVANEARITSLIPFSSLICVMSLAIALNVFSPSVAKELSQKYSKLWVVGEVMLFVLVGASLNVAIATRGGIVILILIVGCLLLRSCGVLLSLASTKFNKKEKLFCVIAYLPKATVQAAIGGIPLSMGLACGEIILTAAVVSILISAPLGAYLIDKCAKKMLV